MNITPILNAFGFDVDGYLLNPLGNGLINSTWIVKQIHTNKEFVLQQINTNVFKAPENIAFNIRMINDFLQKNYPDYLFTSPVKALNGKDMVISSEGNYFRLFYYIRDSVTHNELTKPIQAYEAAKQFGKFTRLLAPLDISKLKVTIPDFHNLDLRYRDFMKSLINADKSKLNAAQNAIEFLINNQSITEEYLKITKSTKFKYRVTHHDTKISNVLFDMNNRGLCVIDLDTIMPGYFISDVGDMMRTYLSPVSEEEQDFDKIEVRLEFFEAIVKGYLSEMKNELTNEELHAVIYSGKFLIYMQAVRFITDYLNNDAYYGAKYERHNLIRGQNQIQLLKLFMQKEQIFTEVLENVLNN